MTELASETLQTAIATQSEYQIPSIFEVLAQENLRTSVRPAFEYLLKILANHAPGKFGWIVPWFDEIFTVIELFVQHHFLLAHIASYSETYYGLRRKIKGLKIESHRHLGPKLHLLSLATLTLIPYMEVKLKKIYNEVHEKCEDMGSNVELSVFRKMIFWMYPILHTAWECIRMYHQFRFVIHQSKYYDPLLRLMKIKLVIEDPTIAEKSSSNPLSQVLTRMISGGVHAGVFVLRFIEWWYSEDNQSVVHQITDAPIPKPPPSIDSAKTLIKVDDKTSCPLCRRPRRNDTALSTSGYVFCYVCIHKYLKANGKCPVTGYPSRTEHLIKLYIDLE